MNLIQIVVTSLFILFFIGLIIFFFKYMFLPLLLIGLGFYLYAQLTGKRFSFQVKRNPFNVNIHRAYRPQKTDEKIIDVDYTEIS